MVLTVPNSLGVLNSRPSVCRGATGCCAPLRAAVCALGSVTGSICSGSQPILIHLLIVFSPCRCLAREDPAGPQRRPRVRRCFATPVCPCHQRSRPACTLPGG